jgi:hypothetical protein
MSSGDRKQCTATIGNADEKLLAELGYKQEFQRAFTPLEVCYVIIGYVKFSLNFSKGVRHLVQHCWTLALNCVSPSHPFRSQRYSLFEHSSVLFYSIPNGGPVAMVWGVSLFSSTFGLNLS